jgi:transketolase
MTSQQLAQKMRRDILRVSYEKQLCHIASNLSCVDILSVLLTNFPDDLLIMSKGHSMLSAFSAILRSTRPDEETDEFMNNFCANGSRYTWSTAEDERFKNLRFCSYQGSLGHGTALGCGIALANPEKFVNIIVSDGDMNEGSSLEAIMFAKMAGLHNLRIIYDSNGFQAMNSSDDIMDQNSLALYAGNDYGGMKVMFFDGNGPKAQRNLPEVIRDNQFIIARTKKGYPFEWMNCVDWHYYNIDKLKYEQCLNQLDDMGL